MLLYMPLGVIFDHLGNCPSCGEKRRNPYVHGRSKRRNLTSISLTVGNIMRNKGDLQFNMEP